MGDVSAINDEFLVIGGDGTSADALAFKRIYKIDSDRLEAHGFAQKAEVVDLMASPVAATSGR